MKLSAVVLLSVNLVAASQVAANASDTASFLKDALSPTASANTSAAKPAARESQHATKHAAKRSSRAYVAMTPVVDGVKIRPFVPGRYLPSEAEIEAKKQASIAAQQQAAYSAQLPYSSRYDAGMLSGHVASNNVGELGTVLAPAANYASNYAMSRPMNNESITRVIQKVKQVAKNFSAARNVPGMNPVIPGQIAKLPGAPKSIPNIPEPSEEALSYPQVPQPPLGRTAVPVQVPSAPRSNVSAQMPVVPAPVLSSYEERQLNRLVDANLPENVYGSSNGDMKTGQGNPGLAGAGPPSFPLSSNPMSQPRGIRSTIGQQARFGSWHGGNSNLPQSSFQSYMPVHVASPMSISVHHLGNSHKTGRQALAMHPAHHSSSASSTKKSSAPKSAPIQPVAKSYAPYHRYTNFL
jgi:hypothetical protein